MKILPFLTILVLLVSPFQAQPTAQTTYMGWQIQQVDSSRALRHYASLGMDNLDSTRATAVSMPTHDVISAETVWRPMNGTGLPPLNQLTINVILADPSNPKVVYLGTAAYYGQYGGVYRTTNGGVTWEPFNTGLANGAGINMMAITPDGRVLYARDSNYASMGLFRTSTGSAAWTKLTTPIGSDANSIYSMYINSSYVFIGLYAMGMYKSGNQGDTWNQMVHSPQNTVHVIAGVSTDMNLIYAAVVTPYKTTDGGETWEYLTSFNYGVSPCDINYVDAIAISPANTDIVLVGDDNSCLVRSPDGGETLTLVYSGNGVSHVVFDPLNPNLVYMVAIDFGVLFHDGVMKSSDSGQTWVDFNSGLPSWSIRGFDLGPGEAGKPSVLYAGTPYNGVYTTAPSNDHQVFLPVVVK